LGNRKKNVKHTNPKKTSVRKKNVNVEHGEEQPEEEEEEEERPDKKAKKYSDKKVMRYLKQSDTIKVDSANYNTALACTLKYTIIQNITKLPMEAVLQVVKPINDIIRNSGELSSIIPTPTSEEIENDKKEREEMKRQRKSETEKRNDSEEELEEAVQNVDDKYNLHEDQDSQQIEDNDSMDEEGIVKSNNIQE
jgi:hypothetical protein